MDGASKHHEKEKAAMNKASKGRAGKFEATDMSQLASLPGVRTIKSNKKK